MIHYSHDLNLDVALVVGALTSLLTGRPRGPVATAAAFLPGAAAAVPAKFVEIMRQAMLIRGRELLDFVYVPIRSSAVYVRAGTDHDA